MYKGSRPSAHANRPRLGQWIFPTHNPGSRVKGSPIYCNQYLNASDFALFIARKAREAACMFDCAVTRAAAAYASYAATYASYITHAVEAIDSIRRASGFMGASSVFVSVYNRAAHVAATRAAAAVYVTAARAAYSAASSCLARADAALDVNRAHLVYESVIKVCDTPTNKPHDIANHLSKIASINLRNDIASSAVAHACCAVTRARTAAVSPVADACRAITRARTAAAATAGAAGDDSDAAAVAAPAAVATSGDDDAAAAVHAAADDVSYFTSVAHAAAADTAAIVKTLCSPAARVAAAIDTM